MLGDVKDELPLKPLADEKPAPTPAPPWVALASAWLGLITLFCTILLMFLPGSRNPRLELERIRQYSLADRFLPVPAYLSVVSLFVGIVVIWQMRKEPRPLPDAMVAQRVQAYVGLFITLVAITLLYAFVRKHSGPV